MVAAAQFLGGCWFTDPDGRWAPFNRAACCSRWAGCCCSCCSTSRSPTSSPNRDDRCIAFRFGGNFARDMTYSIAWGLFSLGLLGMGIWKQIQTRALRGHRPAGGHPAQGVPARPGGDREHLPHRRAGGRGGHRLHRLVSLSEVLRQTATTLMKSISILLALTGLSHGAEWTAWQWEAPFAIEEAGMARLAVPDAMLDVSRPDLGDLRVVSPDGVETPYLMLSPVIRRDGMSDGRDFRSSLAEDLTVIEVSSGTGDVVNGVELVSPAREFLKSVNIEGRDGGEWKMLAENQVMFRQSGGPERTRVSIPAGTWREIRVTVDDGRSAPIPITGLRLVSRGEIIRDGGVAGGDGGACRAARRKPADIGPRGRKPQHSGVAIAYTCLGVQPGLQRCLFHSDQERRIRFGNHRQGDSLPGAG